MRRERRAGNIRRMRKGSERVEFVIDELILHGFPSFNGAALGQAFSLELERRITESGIRITAGVETPFRQAENIALPANANPEYLGTQVAKAVHGVIES